MAAPASPLLSDPGRRRSRELAARRRRSRRRRIALVMVVLAGLLVTGWLLRRGDSGTRAAPAAVTATRPAVRPASRIRGPAAAPAPALTLALPRGPRLVMSRFHQRARAGILLEAGTGRVLWERMPRRVLPIASLTKMMTAYVVVRRAHAGELVPITREALAYRGSGVGLLPRGRRVRLEPLLYGLLLPSGNDAAIALAQHVAGTVGAFVREMNAVAGRLGLTCTHYTSPDGLDDRNRSCPADLARLAEVDLAQPRIARIVSRRSAVLPFPIKGGKLYLYNNNPLLRSRFPGITGLKTGDTNAAGLCLVATARRGRVRLISVLLDDPDINRQSAALLEAGFRASRPRPFPVGPG